MIASLVTSIVFSVSAFFSPTNGHNGSSTWHYVDSGQSLGSLYSFGVELGDLDGDGDLDAFVANRYAPDRVWLNDGDGLFTDSGQNLGERGYSFDVALADFDADDDLDAFVVNAVNTVDTASRVWLNDGDGRFTSGQVFAYMGEYAATAADVDGDDDADIVVAVSGDPFGGGAPNRVLLNDGNGTLTDSGQSLGNARSRGVAAADLDGDTDLDLFFANTGSNSVWLNDGKGVFSDGGQSLGTSSSRGVALGDLDGDDDIDAYVANESLSNRIWLNDGKGAFADTGQTLGISESQAVALADPDGDGDLDAFVANTWTVGTPINEAAPNRIWINDGDATFTESGSELGQLHSNDIRVADLDGDDDVDIFVANRGDRVSNYGEPNKVYLLTRSAFLYLPLITK